MIDDLESLPKKKQDKEYYRAYYSKNRERILKNQTEYQTNKELVKARKSNYRERNREVLREDSKQYRRRAPEARLLSSAKGRAKKAGLPFNLELSDIHIPEFCPLLGVPLVVGAARSKAGPSSPSLDKIIPEKGYVKGNVWVISVRANTMKQDACFEEFEVMYSRWKKMKDLNYPALGKEKDSV